MSRCCGSRRLHRRVRARDLSGVLLALACVWTCTSCIESEGWSLSKNPGRSHERLRQRQLLRVLGPNGSETRIDILGHGEDTDGFMTNLDEYCKDQLPSICGTVEGACAHHHCSLHAHLCVANSLVEMAGVVASPIDLLPAGVVPPQTTAVNAAIFERAAREARAAVTMAVAGLRQGGDLDAATICSLADLEQTYGPAPDWGPGAEPVTLARSYATAFIEAVSVMREATMAAVSANRAVADGHFSTEGTIADAARLANSAPVLSRAYGAHLLIGGDPGLGGSLAGHGGTVEIDGGVADAGTGDGGVPDPAAGALDTCWCTTDLPNARTQAAIQIIREAAPPPSTITNLARRRWRTSWSAVRTVFGRAF